MEKYAENAEGGFGEAMAKARKMYEKLNKNSIESERQLLLKVMQDIEFADGKPDISTSEFEDFVEHVPEHRRQNFMNKSFKKISGGADTINYKQLTAVIDEVLKEEPVPLDNA